MITKDFNPPSRKSPTVRSCDAVPLFRSRLADARTKRVGRIFPPLRDPAEAVTAPDEASRKNPRPLDRGSFKYKDIGWEKTDPKEQVFNFIKNNSRVLDIGCWAGRLGWELKKNKGCFAVGVDINKEAVSFAKKRLDKAFQLNLNDKEELKKLNNLEKFDYIVIIDVLEHLVDPQELLSFSKKLLKSGGNLIISVPNIANYKIRLDLLLGKFDYENQGILDNTHLRFFTRSSIKKLLSKSGFSIKKEMYTRAKFLPTLFATQFIFVCN